MGLIIATLATLAVVLLLSRGLYNLFEQASLKWRRSRKRKIKYRLKANWPSDLPPMHELAQTLWKASLRESALLIPNVEGGDDDPCGSWMGKVVVGLPEEPWPEYKGKPMIGVCQFNLGESPHVPDELSGLALITFFLPPGYDGNWDNYPGAWSKRAPAEFAIRAYPVVEELTPYRDSPQPPASWKPFKARYEVFMDGLARPHEIEQLRVERGLPEEWAGFVEEAMSPLWHEIGEKQYGSKIGGWPALEESDEPLAFQVSWEPGISLECPEGSPLMFQVWRNGERGNNEWTARIVVTS